MTQFYIDSEVDLKRCEDALQDQLPITITGTDESGNIRAYTGVVKSVDGDKQRPANRRWRITIRD